MKKVLFSLALLFAACAVSFAQEKTVKEAKKIANGTNPDFAKAEELINQSPFFIFSFNLISIRRKWLAWSTSRNKCKLFGI